MESIMDAMVARSRTVNGVPTSLADLGYADVGLDDVSISGARVLDTAPHTQK